MSDDAAVLKGASCKPAYSSDGDAVGDAMASDECVQRVVALRRQQVIVWEPGPVVDIGIPVFDDLVSDIPHIVLELLAGCQDILM